MNKKNFILFSFIISIIGILIVLYSPRLGNISVSYWVQKVGNSVNSQEYLQMLKGYINAYTTIGGIFLFTGLLSLLIQFSQWKK